MSAKDAFDAAVRRYNHAHGIPLAGDRCAKTIPLGDQQRCEDVAGHDGNHHAHAGLAVVTWSDALYGFREGSDDAPTEHP